MKHAKRILLSLALALACCPHIVADSIMDRMRTRDFTDADYIGYMLTRWYEGFLEYPFVVKFSVVTILFCILSITAFTLSIYVNKMYEGHRNRVYHRLYHRFYDIFSDIITSQKELTRSDIDERIQLTLKDQKKRKSASSMFIGCRLLVQVKADYYNEYNYYNMRKLCMALGVQEFLERMLVFGSRSKQRQAMQISQFLMIDLPESVLVRLLNSTNAVLRKETRMYYLWLSDYNPFRFFRDSEMYNYEWREWDALEVHFLMSARNRAKKEMPSLPPVIVDCDNEKLQACLIREVGFWGTPEDIDNMKKYLAHKNVVIRQATIECFIQANTTTVEPMLMNIYAHQDETMRKHILRALVTFNTGRAIPFFVKAWNESKVQATKLYIIMSLSMYGDNGVAEFERMEKDSNEEDHFLFQQVRAFEKHINNLDR